MRMMRWMSDNTPRHRIRNESICKELEVSPAEDKITENHLG